MASSRKPPGEASIWFPSGSPHRRDGRGGGAIGGARSTNEDAYAFGKFMRTVVGSHHLDAQLDDGLDPGLPAGMSPRATIGDLDTAATILLWAPDLKEESCSLYLRVRHAVQERGAKLVVVHPRRTGLDDRGDRQLTYRPGRVRRCWPIWPKGLVITPPCPRPSCEGPVVALVGRPGLTEQPELAEAVAAFALGLPGAKVLPFCPAVKRLRGSRHGGRPDAASRSGRVDEPDAMVQLEAVLGSVTHEVGAWTRGILNGRCDRRSQCAAARRRSRSGPPRPGLWPVRASKQLTLLSPSICF